MYDVNELRYLMAVSFLKEIADAGFLTEEQFAESQKIAKARFFPEGVWE